MKRFCTQLNLYRGLVVLLVVTAGVSAYRLRERTATLRMLVTAALPSGNSNIGKRDTSQLLSAQLSTDNGPAMLQADRSGALICTQDSLRTLLAESGMAGTPRLYLVGGADRLQRYVVEPRTGVRLSHVEADREALLSWLMTLEPGVIGLLGYVGADGDVRALTEADLRR